MVRRLAPVLVAALALAPLAASAQEGFGGARDAGHVRDYTRAGLVPPLEAFNVEGLLSEHHFPVRQERCAGEVCVLAALGHGLHRPSLTRSGYLFIEPVSGLDPRTFRRGPLNAGIVIDVSGSMAGSKFSWAISAAHALVDRLDARDMISIVTFDDTARVVLAPTVVVDRGMLHAVIENIRIGGSTNIHDGLRVGFDQVASVSTGARVDRVFVLTDEQPNVGVTHEGGFLELVGAYARRGIGLTVVGVGLDLGAELASSMSQLEGGAYYYLEGERGIEALFGADFDQRVTPVAYRLAVTVRPSAGLRVAEVFGVPGDDVVRNPDGSVTLRASTVFLDRRRSGAIVRLAPVQREDAALRSSATLTYSYVRASDGQRVSGETSVAHAATSATSLAEFSDLHHYRGYALVNFAELLRASLRHWHAGRPSEALRILTNAREALDLDSRVIDDPQLAQERTLADGILANMRAEGAEVRARVEEAALADGW